MHLSHQYVQGLCTLTVVLNTLPVKLYCISSHKMNTNRHAYALQHDCNSVPYDQKKACYITNDCVSLVKMIADDLRPGVDRMMRKSMLYNK